NMGRTRVHDEATAAALLEAAEKIAETEGLQALTVRRVAEKTGTTTRAVYTSLGSKQALLSGLGVRAFDMLAAIVESLPPASAPAGTGPRTGPARAPSGSGGSPSTTRHCSRSASSRPPCPPTSPRPSPRPPSARCPHCTGASPASATPAASAPAP